MSVRGRAGSLVMAISDVVGNRSSPLWYVWKIAAVRPDLASNVLSAVSRGAEEKPPAAAPQSTPQDGTSLASTVHPGLAATGVSAALAVPAKLRAAVAPIATVATGSRRRRSLVAALVTFVSS